MGWIQLIGSFFVLMLEFWKFWREKDTEKKEEREYLLNEAKAAIDSRNASRLNVVFTRLRDIR